MPSYELQICQEIHARVQAAVGSNATVLLARNESNSERDVPAIDVFPTGDDAENVGRTSTQHRLSVRVDVLVGPTDTDTVLAVADPLVIAIQKALALDPTLGGLCAAIRAGPSEWSYRVGSNGGYALRQQLYQIHFESSAADPSKRSV